MATEAINGAGDVVINSYKLVISSLPPFIGNFINLFVIVLFVILYSVCIWKVHKLISKKNVFDLNLNEKFKTREDFTSHLGSAAFYFLEYMIILPIIVFFWFAMFSVFILIFAENLDVNFVMIIAAAVVASVRMVSYYNEGLSKELAKLLPFNLLAASILFGPGSFNIERIWAQIGEIPSLTGNIFSYLGFIVLIEVVLRFFDFIFTIFGIEED